MSVVIPLLFLAVFAYLAWEVRDYIHAQTAYKDARRAEIRRRLQVEHQQEKALKSALNSPMDDSEKLNLIRKFADERHQRATYYVIQDMFEHKS